MGKFWCIFYYLLAIFGCTADSINTSSKPHDKLKAEILQGDTSSYVMLKTAYLDYPPEKILFWSFIMANEHGYAPANVDIFYTILSGLELEVKDFNKLDRSTQNYLRKCLITGKNSGDLTAIELLSQIDR